MVWVDSPTVQPYAIYTTSLWVDKNTEGSLEPKRPPQAPRLRTQNANLVPQRTRNENYREVVQLRINTNISALNAWKNLSVTGDMMSKSLEKLSSGFRINRAADDAAGLAISEKMRAQTAGLRQASRNAQDGISLIQTAEGALNETHAILQRMRELANQAVNETNTQEDRLEIQKELEQLKEELNGISERTEFNGLKLLNGSLGARGASSDPSNVKVVSATGLTTGDYDVTITKAATKAATSLTFDGTDDKFDEIVTDNNTLYINGVEVDLTGVTTLGGLKDSIVKIADKAGVEVDVTGQKLTLTAIEYGTGHKVELGGDVGQAIKAADSFDEEDGVHAEADVVVGDVTTHIVGVGQEAVYSGAQFSLTGLQNSTATVTVTKSGARMQIGANAGQEMVADISEVSAKTLGTEEKKVSDIGVSSTDYAKEALSVIDAALNQVSSERSKLGAFQNRLDHTINNLQTAAENLTAAESRIRDVDMALEMATFTRHQILMQAGTAMLAQANMAPQSVLRLLG